MDVFSALTAGAAKGLRIMRDIFPALVVLFPAIYLLRASGLPEYIGALLRPLLSNPTVFGVDLYEAGLGETVEQDFCALCAGPGAVRKTLHALVESAQN